VPPPPAPAPASPAWSRPTPTAPPAAAAAPASPAWSRPTPTTPPAPPEPGSRAGTATAGLDTHPGRALPEALSFLDLTPPEPKPLPEALSFLDLSSALDLFETMHDEEPGPQADPRASGELNKADGQVKVMAPLVVKLLPPQPAKSTQPGFGVPRVALKAPVPASPLRAHSWASAARPGPVLQVSLPPEADGGELEVHVQVRRKGALLAESATVIASPGPDGAGTLAIEFKRS
jgi:hypothetical protein